MVDRGSLARKLRSLLWAGPDEAAQQAIRRAEVVATFADYCRDLGPWEIAAAVNSPNDDPRTIAYLFASLVTLSDDRDLAVEAGVVAFAEWARSDGRPAR